MSSESVEEPEAQELWRSSSDPKLSVAVISVGGFAVVEQLWRALLEQTVRADLEIVVVASDFDVADELLEPFQGVVHVPARLHNGLGEAAAIAVRNASAPLVAFTEDHCFPHRDWAESFLADFALHPEVAAVGPTVHNANPDSVVSDSNYWLEYAWVGTEQPKGRAEFVPGHNSCYRRDHLLGFGDELGWWLECETLMHWELGKAGHRFVLSQAAQTDHWCPSRIGPALRFAWPFSRVFAARRRTQLDTASVWKLRLLWPVIPWLRLARLIGVGQRQFGWWRTVRLLPLLTGQLVVSACAEGCGYWFGADEETLSNCLDLEFARDRFLRPGERLRFVPRPERAPS